MLQARLRHGRKDIHLFPRMPALVRVDTGGGISGEDRRLRQSVSPRTRIESTLVRRCVPVSHSAPSFPKSRRQLSPLSPLAHDPPECRLWHGAHARASLLAVPRHPRLFLAPGIRIAQQRNRGAMKALIRNSIAVRTAVLGGHVVHQRMYPLGEELLRHHYQSAITRTAAIVVRLNIINQEMRGDVCPAPSAPSAPSAPCADRFRHCSFLSPLVGVWCRDSGDAHTCYTFAIHLTSASVADCTENVNIRRYVVP